ncbi:MAG: hypothetical protein ACR2QK_17765 [Acidimicrobiales bacterium]
MRPELLQLGINISAIATILGGLVLLALGRSDWLGHSFRTAVRPALDLIRSRSTRSRSELADVSILVAAGLSVAGALVDRQVFAAILAILLWLSRPSVAKLTKEENHLLAKISWFSIDLMIGVYVPIAIAQVLLLNLFLAASFFSVIVALSWPTGGGAIPGRRWKLVPTT